MAGGEKESKSSEREKVRERGREREGGRESGKLTIRDLRDLAQRNARGGGLDLRLAIRQGADNGGGDDLGADDLAVARLRGGAAARHDQDLDGGALGGPVTVVQVEEVAALALVEDGRAAQGQRAVGAGREARRVDGAGLGGLVVLELVVTGNVACAALRVQQRAVRQRRHEDAVARAGVALL